MLKGIPGLGALGDMAGMMKKAQEMQAKMAEMQDAMGRTVVVGEAGAGLVKARATAKGEVTGLVVLASLAYGLWRPHLWISTACAVPALGFAGLLALSERAETATLARAEGCLGSVLPAAFLLLALGAFTILRAWQRD